MTKTKRPECVFKHSTTGMYYYGRARLPRVPIGKAAPGSPEFNAALAVAKKAEKAWLGYIDRKARKMLREMTAGFRRT